MFIKMLLYPRWSSIFMLIDNRRVRTKRNYLKRKNARAHCEGDALKDIEGSSSPFLQVARNVTTEKYFQPRQLSRKSFTACALS